MRESYKEMANEAIWETFKKQLQRKFISDHVHQKKEDEFLALKQNQMSVATYVHTFLQLTKFTEDLVNTEEKKVKRFVGGLHTLYEEHVVVCMRPETFNDVVDSAYTAEELAIKKRAMDPKRSSSHFNKGYLQNRRKGVVIGSSVPKCDTCGKGHMTEKCWRNTGACVVC